MTWVITSLCQDCVDMSCVDVCPVDCIVQFNSADVDDDSSSSWIKNQLYIDPDECIDCGVCEPECPADAIRPDTEPEAEKWVEFNREYSEKWPVIISQKEPLPDAEARDGEEGKLEKYFSEKPGEGG